jgi:hypothetical protein
MAEILEHVTIKVLGIVDRDLLWDAIMTDNVFPKEVFDSGGVYVGDGLHLNSFRKILDYPNGEGVIALCWGELDNYVDAP